MSFDGIKMEPGVSGIGSIAENPETCEEDDGDYKSYLSQESQDDPENYEDELESYLSETVTLDSESHVGKKRQRKENSKIPVHLKGLMGEANLRFARGEHDVAEKMCFEIIRQVPMAHEPYMTLWQIHENCPQKSIQYLTMGAHLRPQEDNLWNKLGQLYVDSGNLKQAVSCYNKAIQANPDNMEYHLKRIQLLEQLDDTKFIRRCKFKLLQTLSPTEPEVMIQLVKELAKLYHKDHDYAKAIEAIQIPFEKCPDAVTPELINILLELLLIQNQFVKCSEIFVQYCDIELTLDVVENNTVKLVSYKMPANLPIDLRVKFIIYVIKMHSFELLDELLAPLLVEDNVGSIGDLYLDVAETLVSEKRPYDALKLLIPLVKSDNYSLPAVWLKHAECLRMCEMYQEAIDSYFTVLRMAPLHTEVRYPLSELLIQNNQIDEAIDVLNQDNSTELDVKLLIRKIKLFELKENYDECFKLTETLVMRHGLEIKDYSEIKAACFAERAERVNRLKVLRAIRGENYEQAQVVSLNEPSVEQEYEFFKRILGVSYSLKKYVWMYRLSFCALTSNRFKNYTGDLLVFSLFSCLYNRDYFHGYEIVREFVFKHPNNNLIWNLWNTTLQYMDDPRQFRYITRQGHMLQGQHLKILEANNAICTGSYKVAVMILSPFLKRNPTPFIMFLTGIAFLQLSQQTANKQKKYITSTVYTLFLNYAKARSKDALHEVNYNLGRLYHKYGILHLAMYYYNLVLEFEHPLIDMYPNVLSLKKEAAFNLFLIYKNSENHIGAHNIMLRYLTV